MKLERLVIVLVIALLLAACGGAPAAQAPAAQEPAAPAAQQPVAPAAPVAQEPAAPVAPAEPTAPVVAEPVRGGSVTRALTTEPTGLDPAGAQGSGQNILLPYLFDTLVAQNNQNMTQPLLAESWDLSADGTSVYFTLREGITFHDGTPLDAEAVVLSFERLLDPANKSPMAASLKIVTAIEAVDARTVRFDLAAPSPIFFVTLTSPYAGIVSPSAVAELGEQFAQQPVGSGPFKLKEWVPGVSITLERNEAYAWASPNLSNAGAPYLDAAIFKVIPDAATQFAAFQAGEIDLMFLNQPDHITRLRDDPSAVLLPVTYNSLVYMGFNTAKAPFDNLGVRQALAHAIDKDVIVQTAVGGEGTSAFAPMATTLLGFDPSLKQYELGYDPAKAEALLTEAGFVKGADGMFSRDGQPLALTLLTYTRAPNQDIATVIQAQLKALGVDVQIQQFDAPTAGKAAVEGAYDARRLFAAILVLVALSAFTFGLLELAPGDVAQTLAGSEADAAQVTALRQQLGLDVPWPVRYGRFLAGAVQGDLGRSAISGRPVSGLVAERFGYTLILSLAAMSLVVVVGGLAGAAAAARPGGRFDLAVMGLITLGQAIPTFWAALMLILVFGLTLRWLPITATVMGFNLLGDGLRDALAPEMARVPNRSNDAAPKTQRRNA
ncbi:MAG: ABC transporter substrate-binding protein [Oscillochloridaceae bacterium umkhey_bin13]